MIMVDRPICISYDEHLNSIVVHHCRTVQQNDLNVIPNERSAIAKTPLCGKKNDLSCIIARTS